MPLFAVCSTDVDKLADFLEIALNALLEHRDSMYWGAYRHLQATYGELRVYPNFDPTYRKAQDPPEEEFFEPDFHCYGVLVGVYGESQFTEAVRQALAAVGSEAALVRQ